MSGKYRFNDSSFATEIINRKNLTFVSEKESEAVIKIHMLTLHEWNDNHTPKKHSWINIINSSQISFQGFLFQGLGFFVF